MYIGIDIGTSAVKSVLIDHEQHVVGCASRPLTVMRPHPQWSEQDPNQWCRATRDTLDELCSDHPQAMGSVAGIGLSGQMHGATLLDASDRPLRPCILWNDGRSTDECNEIESKSARSREITGNLAMPGFTAPKLLWVKNNEPEVFASTARVLLPKDYVRLWLSGDYVSDMSDSAGTLWLDVAARNWSEEMLGVCGLARSQMPDLIEGTEASGQLRTGLARRWGMKNTPLIAGGGGDNAAGACGIGAVKPGHAFISLGTSGVIFVTNESYRPNTDGAVHTFCHAIPRTWHQMGVILSAASSFDWLSVATGTPVPTLFADLETAGDGPGDLFFLPYLSGERTPHNDASLRGAFIGLVHSSDRPALSLAVAEGVGFAFRDCLQVLEEAGTRVEALTAIGGGSRSDKWLHMLSNILDKRIDLPESGELGAAFGAARLGMVAATGTSPFDICQPPRIAKTITPDQPRVQNYRQAWLRYRAMYPVLKEALAA